MKLFRPQTVRGSFSPFLKLSWIFGGAGITVNLQWRILYALIMSAVSVYLNIHWLNIDIETERNTIDYMSLWIGCLKIPVALVFIWLWTLKGVHTVENAIIELTKLDEELRNFHLKVNYKKFMCKQLCNFGGFIILLTVIGVLQMLSVGVRLGSEIVNNSWTYLLIFLSANLLYYQTMIAELLCLMMLEAFRIRFKLVNEIFKQLAESEEQIKVKVLTTSCYPALDISATKFQSCQGNWNFSSHLLMERVDRACRIHRRLSKLAQEVGDVFSIAACADSPILYSHIVLQAVLLVMWIHHQFGSSFAGLTIVLSTIFVVARFSRIIATCSDTSDEANQFGTSLYRLPIENAAVHNQLQEYSLHIVQLKLEFKAGGIFVIDRNLARSTLSTFVKYVVVLFQFWKTDKNGQRSR